MAGVERERECGDCQIDWEEDREEAENEYDQIGTASEHAWTEAKIDNKMKKRMRRYEISIIAGKPRFDEDE